MSKTFRQILRPDSKKIIATIAIILLEAVGGYILATVYGKIVAVTALKGSIHIWMEYLYAAMRVLLQLLIAIGITFYFKRQEKKHASFPVTIVSVFLLLAISEKLTFKLISFITFNTTAGLMQNFALLTPIVVVAYLVSAFAKYIFQMSVGKTSDKDGKNST